MLKHLQNLSSHLKISLPTDESGYIGRQCPNPDCTGYFKIVNGTGLTNIADCHCPYCGHTADQSEFSTPDQIEYAKSLAVRKFEDALVKDLKSMEFNIKPRGQFGIGISMKVKQGRPYPVHWYREKVLETHIQCTGCTLKYAVFGVFAFCPDCCQHNSLQILNKNIEVVGKMLDMSKTADVEVSKRLIENALEDCVSSFDGFGREICRIHAKKSSDPIKTEKISFQNLDGVRQNLLAVFGIDISSVLAPKEWEIVVRCFQKRHLIAHKMGVVDNEYIQKTNDVEAVVGHKVNVSEEEIKQTISILGNIARYISKAM